MVGEAGGRDGIRASLMVRSEGEGVGEDVIGCGRSWDGDWRRRGGGEVVGRKGSVGSRFSLTVCVSL